MYVVHINHRLDGVNSNNATPFSTPHEAVMGMFYMSMGKFISVSTKS